MLVMGGKRITALYRLEVRAGPLLFIFTSRKAGGLILFLLFNAFQLVGVNVICRLLHALIKVIGKTGRETNDQQRSNGETPRRLSFALRLLLKQGAATPTGVVVSEVGQTAIFTLG